jgi:vacuolar-type H+-ATPase subunit C/Vma6
MNHASGYSRIVVRAAAERSHLLSKEKLLHLAETKNLEELTTNLKGSPYENLLITLPEISLENIQRAFSEELFRLYMKTARVSPEELQSFIKEYVSHVEIQNLKTLLKAKNAQLPYETIIGMLHLLIEDLLDRRELFTQAAKAEDIEGSIKAFQDSPYADALSEASPQFKKTKSTRFFDLTLDRVYHEHLLDSTRKLPKKHSRVIMSVLGPCVDMFNILMIIRSKFLGYPSQWIDRAVTSQFYKLSINDIHALTLIEDAASALNVLKQTPYRKFLELHETIEATLTSFEKAMKNRSLKLLEGIRIRDPFNVSTPLSIMMKKEVEIENLTKISSGIEYNWKPEEITSILL